MKLCVFFLVIVYILNDTIFDFYNFQKQANIMGFD